MALVFSGTLMWAVCQWLSDMWKRTGFPSWDKLPSGIHVLVEIVLLKKVGVGISGVIR